MRDKDKPTHLRLPAPSGSTNLDPRREQLRRDSQTLLQNSWSAGTQRVYTSQIRVFLRWCTEHQVSPLPAAMETVRDYLTDRSKAVRPATLALAVQAIRQLHENAGHAPPTAHPQIKRLLKGIRRTHGAPPDQAGAIRLALLFKAVDALPHTMAGLRDRALLLLGWSAALRRSEIAALRVEDCTWHDAGLALLIGRSKTDQEGQGHTLPIHKAQNRGHCPVFVTRFWIEKAALGETGPLFRPVDKRGRVGTKALSGRAVAEIIKRRVRPLAANPEAIRGHSLRSGFITEAAARGIPEDRIQAQSRHKTRGAMAGYIRRGQMFRDDPLGALLDD